MFKECIDCFKYFICGKYNSRKIKKLNANILCYTQQQQQQHQLSIVATLVTTTTNTHNTNKNALSIIIFKNKSSNLIAKGHKKKIRKKQQQHIKTKHSRKTSLYLVLSNCSLLKYTHTYACN